jgi:hypothetical protein
MELATCPLRDASCNSRMASSEMFQTPYDIATAGNRTGKQENGTGTTVTFNFALLLEVTAMVQNTA